MSKKLPVVLNFRYNLKMAGMFPFTTGRRLESIFEQFHYTSNSNWCFFSTVIPSTQLDIFQNKKSICNAAAVNIPTNIECSWICYPFHWHRVLPVFSAHELKVVITHCPWSSVVANLSHFRPETTERNSTKLDRKEDLNVFQVCSGWSEKQDARPVLWLAETLSTSLETAERNSTKLTRKQDLNVLQSLYFFGPIGKIRWPPWSLICWEFCSLNPLNKIQRNLTRRNISMFSTKFAFFGPIGKIRWPPGLLISWNIFDFSETA